MDLFYKAQTRFLFHTDIKIKISAFYDDSIFDELFAVLEAVDKNYNSYQSGSYIDRINQNAGRFVEVDNETVEILKRVICLSAYFDGEYDITVMPLIRLWGFYKDENLQIPTETEIAAAKRHIDYRNIEIDGNHVRIAQGQEIITGSFIKAYAVDKLTERMQRMGINDAIINAGGSTIRAINNEGHPSWQVVVRNPDDDNELFHIALANQCYSTSSHGKTYLSIGGKRYGHILSPATGYPSENKHLGMVSANCLEGDVISTGLFNESPQGFINKMNRLKETFEIEGFLMDKNNSITATDGFESHIIH